MVTRIWKPFTRRAGDMQTTWFSTQRPGISVLQRTAWIAVLLCSPSAVFAQIEFERPPINYGTAKVSDPVAILAEKMAEGSVTLAHDGHFGYLKSLLDELGISASSQSLVFSKTSLQLRRISPKRPRSLYFNDDVYVGFCQNGDVIELAATDPQQGAIFYTLSQEMTEHPTIVRDKGRCLTCHASSRTQKVPGYLLRSVFPDLAGRPKTGTGTHVTDHTSDFLERWGGWYVTGQHGNMRHMGNSIGVLDEKSFDRDSGANRNNLDNYFSTKRFLTPDSDIVALMVLAHQTQMHNAIAAASYETRSALHQCQEMNLLLDRPEDFLSDSAKRRIASSADRVLRYLLFCDEFPLTAPVIGSTNFASEFESLGVRDQQGRHLREFDLKTRMFRFPCSYLIYSDAFAALPKIVRDQILDRLVRILNLENSDPNYLHIDDESKLAILNILRETLPMFEDSYRKRTTSQSVDS